MPPVTDAAIRHVRGLFDRGEDDALIDGIDKLVEQAPDDPRVGDLLIEIASDRRAWIRGHAMRELSRFPSILDRVLPVWVAGLKDEDPGYGGGWSECVHCDVVAAIDVLGSAAKAIAPDLEQALRRWLRDQNTEGVAAPIKTLIGFCGPEQVAEVVFEELLNTDHRAEEAARLTLGMWPNSQPWPEFLLQHVDATVVAVVLDVALDGWLWKTSDHVAVALAALIAAVGPDVATDRAVQKLGELGFKPDESARLILAWWPSGAAAPASFR